MTSLTTPHAPLSAKLPFLSSYFGFCFSPLSLFNLLHLRYVTTYLNGTSVDTTLQHSIGPYVYRSHIFARQCRIIDPYCL